MGNIITAPLAAQQTKMVESQKIMVMRQIEMQQAMRERMVATQIAIARDMFRFYGSFYAVALVGLGGASLLRRNPALAIPLVPLGFACAYQYDMAYGGKMDRIVAEADAILRSEAHLLAMPGGPLTVAGLDAAAAARVEPLPQPRTNAALLEGPRSGARLQ